MSLKKIVEQLKRNKAFLITSHVNPEADAVGSQLAFLYLLRKLKKKALVVNESEVPFECRFLPGVNAIKKFSNQGKGFDTFAELKPHGLSARSKSLLFNISPERSVSIDCAVFLDCSDSSRAGIVNRLIKNDTITLNIDHHASNTYFATFNWVSSRASCTCELIYRLYRHLDVPIDKDVAVMLYAGMVSDTGSFRFNNTSAACHRLAASFINKGVLVAEVYNALYQINLFKDIKLLGSVLSTIRTNPDGKMAWADISSLGLGNKFPSLDLSEMVLSLLRSIKGVELAIVFKEAKKMKGKFRVNFRSQNKFDCNLLASKFGGGGHRNASGATLTGNDPKRIRNKILRYAQKLLSDYA